MTTDIAVGTVYRAGDLDLTYAGPVALVDGAPAGAKLQTGPHTVLVTGRPSDPFVGVDGDVGWESEHPGADDALVHAAADAFRAVCAERTQLELARFSHAA